MKKITSIKNKWNKIRKFGQATAIKMKIKSESDVYKILGDK